MMLSTSQKNLLSTQLSSNSTSGIRKNSIDNFIQKEEYVTSNLEKTIAENKLIVSTIAQEKNTQLKVNIQSSNVGKVISFGVNSLLIATHLIGNGVILTSLGPAEQAATSLISSIQSVSSGTIFGILLSTGVELGSVLAIAEKKLVEGDEKEARKRFAEAGTIIKISWITGISLSLITSAGFLLMPTFMPHIVAPATGKAVSDFFSTFTIGAFADPLIASNGIVIALIEKNWIVPLLSTAIYRLPALGLSYLFTHKLHLGARGVGLGTGLAGLSSFLATQIWFSRKVYKKYGLYKLSLPNFKEHIIPFFNGGWKLALQRLSEWGNITAIALLIGYRSNDALKALQPAIHANTLIGLGLQGMGQAAMVFIGRDCASQRQHYKKFKESLSKNELEQFFKLKNKNKIAFYKNNFVGFLLSTGLATGIYLAQKPIINLFLGSKVDLNEYELAESLLFYNLVGMLPDALRIMSGGILRGWGDLLLPTLMSILLMTIIGVPVGGIISGYVADNNPLPIFWVRMVTIAISALVNYLRFFQHTRKDTQLYLKGIYSLDVYQALTQWEQTNCNFPTQLSEDLLQNNNGVDFEITINTAENNRFFNSIATLLGEEETEESLKKLAAEKIAGKINKYLREFDCDREGFFEILSSGQANITAKVVTTILTEILQVNIVILNDNKEPIQFNKLASNLRTFYLNLKEDSKYYALNEDSEFLFSTNGQQGTSICLKKTTSAISLKTLLFSSKPNRTVREPKKAEETHLLSNAVNINNYQTYIQNRM